MASREFSERNTLMSARAGGGKEWKERERDV